MKKLFPYILIVLIVVQLLVPFTIGVGVKNNPIVRVNKAEAANNDYVYYVTTIAQNGTRTPAENRTTFITDNTTTQGTCETNRTESKKLDTATRVTDSMCIAVATGTAVSTGGTIFNPTGGLGVIVDPAKPSNDSNLACVTGVASFHIGACIAQGLYWLFFKTTSALFGLAGKIMDLTLKYSLNDTSYRSVFVVEGWGVIRDFCNMFFIFVLLYIAFGTILNLNGVKTKEMIIRVVIIGLLINFSLFATQIIIDASNILARVFYNPQTIVITQKDASGNVIPNSNSGLGDFGEIKLSEAIVSKIDPQKIVMNSQGIDQIPTKSINGGDESTTTDKGMSVGTFILIIFITTAVNIVGMLVFLSCAFIFVGRVVMLWIAMILAPIAFFSYTVPALEGIKMIGWKHWWSDTLSMAFLAPVFAFFMYIIVGFMDKGLKIVDVSLKNATVGLSSVVAVIVPFIFIMVLLMQAKKIAVSMSGDVGAALSKAGAAVGGAVTGGLIGAGAMAMRGTVGKLGNKLDNAGWVNKMAGSKNLFSKFVGNKFKDAGQSVGKKSFDVRATGLGAAAGTAVGASFGKAKEGGFIKDRENKVKKNRKRAQEIGEQEDEDTTQKVREEEINLQQVLNAVNDDLERIEKDLVTERQIKQDNANSPMNTAGQRAHDAAVAKIQVLNDAKAKIRNVDGSAASVAAAVAAAVAAPLDKDLAAVVKAANACAKVGRRSIKQRQSEDIPNAKNAKITEKRRRTTNFANNISFLGGAGNRKAQHAIIMEDKIESSDKH